MSTGSRVSLPGSAEQNASGVNVDPSVLGGFCSFVGTDYVFICDLTSIEVKWGNAAFRARGNNADQKVDLLKIIRTT